MPVTTDQEIEMLKWVKKGINMGYINGPFKLGELDPTSYVPSPFGAVTQKNKVRPIVNCSSPKKSNKSVNSHIEDKFKTVKYISLFEVVKLFHSLGPGAYVWAADAKDAYLIVPIKQKDHKLMSFQWKGYIFLLTTLMFGLASACNIYTKFADAVKYIVTNSKPEIFYYHPINPKQIIELLYVKYPIISANLHRIYI